VVLVGFLAAGLVGAFAVVWSLFLLVAMNGFSERQAMPVLIVHGLNALVSLVLAGFGAGAFARRMARERPVGLGLGFVSVLLGAGAGSVLVAIVSIAAMVVMSTR
jgi:hypothetical protein